MRHIMLYRKGHFAVGLDLSLMVRIYSKKEWLQVSRGGKDNVAVSYY